MLEIGRAIVSLDILEKEFLCDLLKCKGACCVEGDSGAPVTPDEVQEIEKAYPEFKSYIPLNHQQEIADQGFAVIDIEGDLVTPLVDNRQCAYSYKEHGIIKCGIEKAYLDQKITFRKPVSCHLFPIRITEYKRFDAVNYERLDICKPGRQCGKSARLPVYVFLKEPLIRKYGSDWYSQLEYAAENSSGFKKQ